MPRYAFQMPNALIYLGSIFRPSSLRPHLRAPSISSIDFQSLKRAGFNAVVIDKDNCLTIPEEDVVYPPLAESWRNLLGTFPGRVLVVSNSAGLLPKDPGAIAAEAVSLNLRAPVLVRQTAKPGCSQSILSFFKGELGKPTTLRGELREEEDRIKQNERRDEMDIVKRWDKTIMGPLLGPLVDKDGNEIKLKDGEKVNGSSTGTGTDGEAEADPKQDQSLGSRMRKSQYETNSTPTPEQAERVEKAELHHEQKQAKREEETLRILVIGDRLFTDTLLANRLAKLLPTPTAPKSTESETDPSITPANAVQMPTVISIHTTLLPQPKDVRFLRWVENRLTKGRIRSGPIDYGRFILRDPSTDPATASAAPLIPSTWQERLRNRMNPFKDTPPLTWHPRSWKPAPLAVGLGSGVWYVSQMTGRGLWKLLSKAWEGEVEVAKYLAGRAELAGKAKPVKEAEGVVEKVETAGSVLSDKKVAS